MIVLLTLAHARPCAGLVTESCEATNAIQQLVNASGPVLVDEGPVERFLWSRAYDNIESIRQVASSNGCVVDGVALWGAQGGRYVGGNHTGEWIGLVGGGSGTVVGTYQAGTRVVAGSYTGAASGDIGSLFGRYDGAGRIAADRDGGFVMGHWVRISGRRGFHYEVYGQCEWDVPTAFDSWFAGGLGPWIGLDGDLDLVTDDDELRAGTDAGDPSSTPVVLRVDRNATGAGDGSTWDDAYPSLQDALSAAAAGATAQTPYLVWVAAGTHYPDEGLAVAAGDRDATFVLPSFTHVYGGFAGLENATHQRSGTASVLDGDIDGDGAEAGNSHHVVRSSGQHVGTLDGFTITGANDETGAGLGGGGLLMVCQGGSSCSASLRKLVFTDNTSTSGSGALQALVLSGGTLTLELRDIRAEDNGGSIALGFSAFQPGAALTLTGAGIEVTTTRSGGGLAVSTLGGTADATLGQLWVHDNLAGGVGLLAFQGGTTTLDLVDAVFEDNAGQAISNYANEVGSSGTLTARNLRISGHATTSNGAGIGSFSELNGATHLELIDAELTDNHTSGSGGAIAVFSQAGPTSATLTNTRLAANTAGGVGGGLYFQGAGGTGPASAELTNVEIALNEAAAGGGAFLFGPGGQTTATLLQTTVAHNIATNVDVDPLIPPGGGGLWTLSVDATVQNTVIWGNTAVAGANVLEVGSPATYHHSLVQDLNPAGIGNLDGTLLVNDPLFVDPVAGDFSLGLGSSAIDQGDDAVVPPGVTTDLAGADRFVGPVDLGALEAQ